MPGASRWWPPATRNSEPAERRRRCPRSGLAGREPGGLAFGIEAVDQVARLGVAAEEVAAIERRDLSRRQPQQQPGDAAREGVFKGAEEHAPPVPAGGLELGQAGVGVLV